MKRKLLIGFSVILIIVLNAVLLLEPSSFLLKAYELPDGIIKINATYSDDCLIVLYENCMLIYDVYGKTEIFFSDNTYIDFCAVSRDNIMLLNSQNNVVHYVNGEFISTDYHDILSIAYTNNSYIFFTDNGEIYAENKYICSLNDNAYKLLGTPEPAYSLKNIIYYLDSDLYCYNIEAGNIYFFEKCIFEVNMCGVVIVDSEGNIKHFREGDNITLIKCPKSQDIVQISSRINGRGYLLLYKNGDIKALKHDKEGKLCEDKKITNYASELYYNNPLRNDLSTCWNYIRKINKIDVIDCIYTSPCGNIKINQQTIYIKSENKLYVYY